MTTCLETVALQFTRPVTLSHLCKIAENGLFLWFFALTALHMVGMDEAIAADPNVPGPILVLPQPDIAGFDRELFISDGSNVSEVFDPKTIFKRTSDWHRAKADENFINDWDTFL